jgi:hypothetical protein
MQSPSECRPSYKCIYSANYATYYSSPSFRHQDASIFYYFTKDGIETPHQNRLTARLSIHDNGAEEKLNGKCTWP